MKLPSIILSLLFFSHAFAADLEALYNLYQKRYQSNFQPRHCGRNIQGFLHEAIQKKIDLANSYVLDLRGEGFLLTRGFYTRGKPDEEQNLGYFHIVFVADGYVFDFHLDSKNIYTMEEYVRLMLTPPYEPYILFGIDFTKNKNPHHYTYRKLKSDEYGSQSGKEVVVENGVLKDIVNFEKVFQIDRNLIE